MINMTEFKSLNERGYYKCFSPNVYRFLKQNDFYYVAKHIHPVTGRTYFEFEMTDELDKALKQFTADKKKYMESKESH